MSEKYAFSTSPQEIETFKMVRYVPSRNYLEIYVEHCRNNAENSFYGTLFLIAG